MTRQLTFDLPARDAMRREDFFAAPANDLALRAIYGWRDWPGRKMLLVGPMGAGKSHLAAIWAADTGAATLAGQDLATADIAALAEQGAVVVDDAEAVAGDAAGEAALFHLHNLITQTGALLMTAATAPRDWGLHLPDLLSRLQAAPLTRLDPPDDTLLSAVLIKLFADRQITVPASLIPYLLARMPRSIGAARALVAALDARALELGRPVSRQMAGDLLDSAPDE